MEHEPIIGFKCDYRVILESIKRDSKRMAMLIVSIDRERNLINYTPGVLIRLNPRLLQ